MPVWVLEKHLLDKKVHDKKHRVQGLLNMVSPEVCFVRNNAYNITRRLFGRKKPLFISGFLFFLWDARRLVWQSL